MAAKKTSKAAPKTSKKTEVKKAPPPPGALAFVPIPEALPTFQQDLATRDQAIRALAHSLNTDDHRVIVTADEAPNPYILRRPSGIMELDVDLAGGFPAGGASFISGPDNSGKTWLMLKTMAQQQKLLGHNCRLACALSESAFPFDQALLAGLKIAFPDELINQKEEVNRLRGLPAYTLEERLQFKEKVGEFYVIRGNTGEEILETILECVRSNAFNIIGCDSLNGLNPRANAEKALDANDKRAAHAVMFGKFLEKYVPITTGLNGVNQTTLLFTQQVRSNQERASAPAHIQQYLKPYAIAGGWAARHYKLIDLMLWDGKTLKNSDKVATGKMINWSTEKGKAGTHDNKQGDMAFYYKGGVDSVGELLTSCIKRGILQQNGKNVVVVRPDTKQILPEFTAPNQKAMRKMLETDFDFEVALRREVLAQAGIQCLFH